MMTRLQTLSWSKSWMKLKLALLGLLTFLATPALAYPTSILSIPTAETLEAGNLHFGLYSTTPYDPSSASIDGSINAGIFNGFDIGGVKVGGLELGFDGILPDPGSGIFSFSGKLSLLGETDALPGIAIGTYYLGVPNMDLSPNLTYAAVSKTLTSGGYELGSWTAGVTRPSPSVNNGLEGLLLCAGVTYDLPFNLGFAADYTSGTSQYSATNVGLYYSPLEALSFTAGYAFSGDRQEPSDYPFFYIDYNLSFGPTSD